MQFSTTKVMLLVFIFHSSPSHATASVYCSNDATGMGFEVQYGSSGDYEGSKLHSDKDGKNYYSVIRKWGRLDLGAQIVNIVGSTDDLIASNGDLIENTALGDLVFISDRARGVLNIGGVQHELECDWSA